MKKLTKVSNLVAILLLCLLCKAIDDLSDFESVEPCFYSTKELFGNNVAESYSIKSDLDFLT